MVPGSELSRQYPSNTGRILRALRYICMSSGCGHGGFNLMRTAMTWLETKDDKEISYKGLEKGKRKKEERESEREPSARNS